MKWAQLVCWSLVLVVGSFTGGWYANNRLITNSKKSSKYSHMKGDYRFTSPLLDVELPGGLTITSEPIPFKYKIENLVRDQLKRGNVQKVSFYYRDLHDGPWFGIDEDVAFNPASMMKIPVLLAWLKRAEKSPAILQHKFIYDGRDDLTAGQRLKPQKSIVAGSSYTVEELLRYMLNFSDNNATRLLFEQVTQAELDQVLADLNIESGVTEEGNSISPHAYSGFFRVLYNASYLNREYSEYALRLLCEQSFPQGMAAGLPAGIPLAAKFGEFTRSTSGKELQLHEFGIIYHPRHPYVLGIMTLGSDVDAQAAVIREISRITYQSVDVSPK